MQGGRAKLEAAKAQKFRTLARHAQAHAPYQLIVARDSGAS